MGRPISNAISEIRRRPDRRDRRLSDFYSQLYRGHGSVSNSYKPPDLRETPLDLQDTPLHHFDRTMPDYKTRPAHGERHFADRLRPRQHLIQLGLLKSEANAPFLLPQREREQRRAGGD